MWLDCLDYWRRQVVRCDKKVGRRQSDWWGSARDYLCDLPACWRGPMPYVEGQPAECREGNLEEGQGERRRE